MFKHKFSIHIIVIKGEILHHAFSRDERHIQLEQLEMYTSTSCKLSNLQNKRQFKICAHIFQLTLEILRIVKSEVSVLVKQRSREYIREDFVTIQKYMSHHLYLVIPNKLCTKNSVLNFTKFCFI